MRHWDGPGSCSVLIYLSLQAFAPTSLTAGNAFSPLSAIQLCLAVYLSLLPSCRPGMSQNTPEGSEWMDGRAGPGEARRAPGAQNIKRYMHTCVVLALWRVHGCLWKPA